MSSTRQGALSLAHSSVSIAQVTAWLEDLCWGDYSLSCYYKSNIFTIGFFFFFVVGFYEIGSCELFAWAGFELQSS
jgi:hypothetical protein